MPTTRTTPSPRPTLPQPLRGVRVLSLALNLPGPAALMRLRAWGARCSKLEPPSGDPMAAYNPAAYAEMHAGVKVFAADLRSDKGQARIHRALARTDVLLTSFRPSALRKLGLDWKALHKAYPALSQVAIVGSHGDRAEEPGHDLTYMAENDLVAGLDLPPTLYADMGGSLAASEAVLAAVLQQRSPAAKGRGTFVEVALASAAQYLGLPRHWGLTRSGAAVGGGHAGYRIYPCKDGRVAMAALEPHFSTALCLAAGVPDGGVKGMFTQATHEGIAAFLAGRTRAQLDALARAKDIPLHTLPR
jgi:alpha-methylacyl-CoA racemase